MKRITKFLVAMTTLALMSVAALTVMAVPGAFDFDTAGNPIPDGTVVTVDVIDSLPDPIVFDVTDATNATEYEWRLWYPGSDTGGAFDTSITDSDDTNFDTVINVPKAGLGLAITSGGEGTYTWTIAAIDSGDTTETEITGGPFTFEIDLAPGAFDFVDGTPPAVVDGGVVDSVLGADLTFSVTAPLDADTVTWYADAGATVDPMTAPFDIALVLNGGTGDYDLTIPAATVNSLANGDYTWTIWAENTFGATPVDGAPFTFTVARAPGAFDFVAGDPPAAVDGGTITAALAADLEFSVTVPATDFDTGTDTVTWYADAGATVDPLGPAALEVDLVYDMANDEYDLTIPATVVNGLANGQYTWTIWADNGSDVTPVDGAPFSFTIDIATGPMTIERYSPAADETVTGPGWPAFTFEDIGADWYQVWIGYSRNATVPYGYTGLFTWYQADDASAFGVAGAGICAEGTCTIPVADTYGIQLGTNAEYEWWMTYWSEDTPAFNDYWHETFFTLDYPTTGNAIAATSPVSGSTLNAEPTEIVWPRQAGVLWFNVWLGTGLSDSYSTQLYFNWVHADDICDATVCTWDVSGFSFPDNDYEMWVQIWGPNGYVTWLDVTDNPLEFTVDTSGAN